MEEVLRFLLPAIPTILAPVLLFVGIRCLRRKRLIENVPTSKVEGVFIGLTEVKGQAEPRYQIFSYLAERQVVYYRFDVQEQWRKRETYTDSEGRTRTRTRTGWSTVRSDEVRQPFFLRDDTGAIRVQPARAEIQADCLFSRTCGPYDPLYYAKGPHYAIAYSTYRRRFTEYGIEVGQDLYIMGNAKLREDVVEPEIRYDADDEMYLISTGTEEEIVSAYGWKAFGGVLGGFLALLLAPIAWCMVIYDVSFGAAAGMTWLINLGLALLYGGAVFLLYLQTVYNGLIEVRNRLEQAFSMIDIQLKRRHDLIPNLVSLVQRYAQHERDVHENLAKLRTEGFQGRQAMGLPDEVIAMQVAGVADQQTQMLQSLYTYVERYPNLYADQSFLRLQEELARTERKIALARQFYNESVTALNDRQQTMPDVLVAKPLGFKEAAHLKIQEFERAPVQVSFQEQAEEVGQPKDFRMEAPPEDATALSAAEIAEQQTRDRSAWDQGED